MSYWHSAGVLALTASCGFTASPDCSHQQERAGEVRRRAVYVTAIDRHGAPVTDLTAAEFSVKEGGQVVSPMLRSRVEATTPGQLLGENHNLGVVLGDGAKQSGGLRMEIAAATGIPLGLHELAESLKHQYVIEYALPAGVKPSDRISVSLKRRGVSLRAPTPIPGGP